MTILGEFVASQTEPVWTGSLVAALGALGVQEKSARQALTRSTADGWLVAERVGRRTRFTLGADTRALLEEGAQRIYSFGDGRTDWDGRWLVLLVSVPEESRPLRHRLRTGLAWAGFGSLGGGVWVTPEPSREDEARKLLDGLYLSHGGPAVAVSSFVGPHGSLGDEAALVSRAWDLPNLEARYQDFLARFSPPCVAGEEDAADGEATFAAGDEATFAAQTRLVHEWRRFPLLDPGLPDGLLASTWPGLAARKLFQARHREWEPVARRWFAAAS